MARVILESPYDRRDDAQIEIHEVEENVYDVYFNGTYQSSAYTNRESLIALRDELDRILAAKT